MSVVDRIDRSLIIEDATMIFKNFAGREGKFNREGDRSFSVLLPPELAERLEREGWNIKYLKVREEGDIPQAHVHVSVSFDKGRPPKITMVTYNGCRHTSDVECRRKHRKTPIEEDMCDLLDHIDIQTVDLILNPYTWTVPGFGKELPRTGVKAYLKTMYVVLHEDYLDLKYGDLDDLPSRAGREIEAGVPWIEGSVVEDD